MLASSPNSPTHPLILTFRRATLHQQLYKSIPFYFLFSSFFVPESKRIHRYALAAFLTAMGIAGPLGLKAIATIAGKALVISKVALTIAGIIALKKIFTSDHHHSEKSIHVVSDEGGSSGGGNRRNGMAYGVRPLKPMTMASAYGHHHHDPYSYYRK